jgi:hypothetical protein
MENSKKHTKNIKRIYQSTSPPAHTHTHTHTHTRLNLFLCFLFFPNIYMDEGGGDKDSRSP